MTRSAVELRGLGDTSSCRENTHPHDDAASYPNGAIGSDTEIGPAVDVVVTKQHNQYTVEIEIDSMMKRWNEILDHYQEVFQGCLTELAPDHTEPMQVDENTPSTGRLVAWKSQLSPSAATSPKIGETHFIPGIRRVMI